MVDYTVKERGQQDKARFQKLLNFQGPDHDTLSLLEERAADWSLHPLSFWERPLGGASDAQISLNPQAQIVSCYLQSNRDDA